MYIELEREALIDLALALPTASPMVSTFFKLLPSIFVDGWDTSRRVGKVSLSGKKANNWQLLVELISKYTQPTDREADHLQKIYLEFNKIDKPIVPCRATKDCHYASKLLFIYDKDYPRFLREIYNAPVVLAYDGNVSVLEANTAISIVGTRNISDYSKIEISRLLDFLSFYKVCTVSGLANGVDTAVHMGSLSRGIPTAAILPNSLNNVTPRKNLGLANRIVTRGGLILSEYIHEPAYTPANYVLRNRLIAGISPITILIQAPSTSGALITVRSALSEDRSVYVVMARSTDLDFAGNFSLFNNPAVMPLDLGYGDLGEELANLGVDKKTKNAATSGPVKHGLVLELIANGNNTLSKLLGCLEEKFDSLYIQKLLAKYTIDGVISRDEFGRYYLK